MAVMMLLLSCNKQEDVKYKIIKSDIIVDAKIDDWKNIKAVFVGDTSKLWVGQGMVVENWKGKDDLSFTWKSAYNNNKIYFLFDVNDDVLIDPAQQPLSFLNDVIEVMLDPKNEKGNRFNIVDSNKKLKGYEMHFLPSSGNEVFIDDSLIPEYKMDFSQKELFVTKWKGEITSAKRDGGYILELGFEVPNLEISSGKIIGLDVDVCDDDGDGRKSLMIWSGENNEFWISMDKYPNVIFE